MPSRFPNCPWRLGTNLTIAERLAIGNELAREAMDSPAVRALAQQIAADCFGCTKARLAEKALRAVQNLGYVLDSPGDWIQPVEFTLKNGGDCEDGTIAFLAVCWLLGIRARNVWRIQEGHPLDHITGAVGLPVGERPSFAGARPIPVGELPFELRDPALTWWWADTSIGGCTVRSDTCAQLGEEVYDAADRLRNHASTRAPGIVDYRTPEQRQSDTNTANALTFVGDTIRVSGQTVSAIIASGNTQQLNLLVSAARLRMAEVERQIDVATIPAQLEALRQQREALAAAQAQGEAALQRSAEQTQMYVGAGLAAVAIAAVAYVVANNNAAGQHREAA